MFTVDELHAEYLQPNERKMTELEEAAEKHASNHEPTGCDEWHNSKMDFEFGANWQLDRIKAVIEKRKKYYQSEYEYPSAWTIVDELENILKLIKQ